MKAALIFLFLLTFASGCHHVQPSEVSATVIGFDYSYQLCGATWMLQIGTEQRRVSLPPSYQWPGKDVLIRYRDDTASDIAKQCRFISLVSVRKK